MVVRPPQPIYHIRRNRVRSIGRRRPAGRRRPGRTVASAGSRADEWNRPAVCRAAATCGYGSATAGDRLPNPIGFPPRRREPSYRGRAWPLSLLRNTSAVVRFHPSGSRISPVLIRSSSLGVTCATMLLYGKSSAGPKPNASTRPISRVASLISNSLIGSSGCYSLSTTNR